MSKITGVISPCITIFNENNVIDQEATLNLWMDLFENKVDGLFVTGSYGLGPLMTKEERITLFNIAVEAKKNYPDRSIIAHVGAPDTETAVFLAKEAEKMGFDAVAAVPPWYNKYNEEQIFNYFKAIIKSVNIPAYAYNNPNTSGYMFTLKFVNRLQEIGLKGLKDASVDFKFLSAVYYDAMIHNKDFHVILGTENCWLTWSQMGADTIIGGMTNYVPDVDYKVKEIFKTDNYTAKVEAYTLLSQFRSKVLFTDSTICSHLALNAQGKYSGYTRAPLAIPENPTKVEELAGFIQKIREDIDSVILKYDLTIGLESALA
ncbi:dihydrodipicolinate synthase family protein [Neobacillus sp. 3P2-tot-E-2]|uniref:dihydrodipicolinate synthase family protein n=1 Tax=Neobacillus sp. 3P2-tot-E-2 TaxID=3132212 RepID=UPI0039A10407